MDEVPPPLLLSWLSREKLSPLPPYADTRFVFLDFRILGNARTNDLSDNIGLCQCRCALELGYLSMMNNDRHEKTLAWPVALTVEFRKRENFRFVSGTGCQQPFTAFKL